MRLDIARRLRILSIYEENDLNFKKNKYQILQQLAARESIFASTVTVRKIVKKWHEYGKEKR